MAHQRRNRSARPRPSGRFVLRLSPELHATLRHEAAATGVSLNELCVDKLARPAGTASELEPARTIVPRCAAVLGEDLMGVVAFGSWARGEAVTTSDIDVLVVVAATRDVTRELYRRWDEQPLAWDSHPVEPHFVHAPQAQHVGTLWAESAVDGIVLFERGLEVSRQLANVRREIVEGRLVRRVVHGQPYWAEVA
jgi:HicB family/Nucleotidyltransferase domain